jgi:hypothetical protein
VRSIRLVLLLLSPALGSVSSQSDWSEGPGEPGPVTVWGAEFSSHVLTAWEDLPGDLLLAFESIAHSVSTYMGSLHVGHTADMDGDGDMDILSDSYVRKLIAWFENDGTGSGWERHNVSSYGELYSPRACYPVDIDGDGDMDVLGTENSATWKRIYLWINADGTGSDWVTYIIDNDAHSPYSICAADIDGDGDPDIIAGDFGPDGQIAWYENKLPQEDWDWTEHPVVSISNSREIYPLDLDQDGDQDILAATESDQQVAWWENLDGSGDAWDDHTICDDISQATSVHAADIDGDDDLDVVAVGLWDAARISWFENLDGFGHSWTEHVLQSQFYGGAAVRASDIDGDGDFDILGAAGNRTPPPPGLYTLYLWENVDGSGENWIRHSLATGSWFEDLAVADIDGDDTLDVVSFASVGSIIAWYHLGYASFGYLESSILDTGNYPHWDQILWEDSLPPGADLWFQVRSSNDPDAMGSWSEHINEPGTLEGYIDSTFRYLQYKVTLSDPGRFSTPVLHEVHFIWDWLGIEEGSEGEGTFLYPVTPNPAPGSVMIRFRLVEPGLVSISIYDISGHLCETPLERELLAGEHGVAVAGLPPGAYFVKMSVGEMILTRRFILAGG